MYDVLWWKLCNSGLIEIMVLNISCVVTQRLISMETVLFLGGTYVNLNVRDRVNGLTYFGAI